MFKLTEQFTSSSKAGVESFVSLANATFAGFERLTALNLNTARSLLEDSAVSTRALLEARDLPALVSLQSTLTQPGVETTAAYSRSVYEIATQTQGSLTKVVEAQVSELNGKLGLALDQAVKTAPAGSDLAVNAMRVALSAANSAYDSLSKAARQATEMAEANLVAAANFAASTSKKAA